MTQGNAPHRTETAPRQMVCGDACLTIDGGKLRGLSFAGTEVIRAISAPVRDENWGTLPEQTTAETVVEKPDEVVWHRSYRVGDGLLDGEITARLSADALDVTLQLTPTRDLRTNRAGFCVLHPLLGVEGQALTIRHPDGGDSVIRFPELIQADQPARNIVSLHHLAGPVEVRITFDGDVFEMEDQRNWSDASFKTYCRPLDRPFPYPLSADVPIVQRIRTTFALADSNAPREKAVPQSTSAVLPEILLALETGWWSRAVPKGAGLLLRVGEGLHWDKSALAEIASAQVPVDIECIVPDDGEPAIALLAIRDSLQAAGLVPRHVTALPKAYLRSYQPTATWPGGVTPEAATRAAMDVFSGAAVGVGFLTYFTELNRCRPRDGVGRFITHGNAAIVHEADDMSVWQTLEALPSVFASARAIGGERAYRLGLCAIAMRSNPYGAGLSPNPAGVLKTMTDDDPRQRSSFAGAYAIAVAAIAARAGAEAVALSAPSGPFGHVSSEGPRPVHAAVSALARLANQRAEIKTSGGLYVVRCGNDLVCANASPMVQGFELPAAARLWSGTDAVDVPSGPVTLPPGSFLLCNEGPA